LFEFVDTLKTSIWSKRRRTKIRKKSLLILLMLTIY